MSAHYFYHAPDGRVYGPIDRATMELWASQGRLRADSRLQLKGQSDFLTWQEVQALPLDPTPTVPVPPVISPSSEPTEEEPLPLVSHLLLLQEGYQLYRTHFRTLVGIATLACFPSLLFELWVALANIPSDSSTLAQHPRLVFFIFAGTIFTAFCAQLGLWLSAIYLNKTDESAPATITEALQQLRGQLWPVLWTELWAKTMIGLQLLMSLLAFTSAYGLRGKSHVIVPILFALLGLILLVPALLMILRWSLVFLAVLVEGRQGNAALQRSQALVSYPSKSGFALEGFWRILTMLAFPMGIILFASLLGQHLYGLGHNGEAMVNPTFVFLSAFIRYAASCLASSLGLCLLYHCYRSLAERVEEV